MGDEKKPVLTCFRCALCGKVTPFYEGSFPEAGQRFYCTWCGGLWESQGRNGCALAATCSGVELAVVPVVTPQIIHCPMCRERHVDQGEFASKPHHTHACQSCGFVWRPAIGYTVGVRFLPGFKDAP